MAAFYDIITGHLPRSSLCFWGGFRPPALPVTLLVGNIQASLDMGPKSLDLQEDLDQPLDTRGEGVSMTQSSRLTTGYTSGSNHDGLRNPGIEVSHGAGFRK